MKKFEVQTGTMAVEVLGITNYSELQKILGEKAAQEIVCENTADKQGILENVKHYKAIRTPLKKTRAEANKMLKLKSKEVLEEFDTAISLVSDYIEPYETAVNEYDEQNRVKKLERLRKKFLPEVEKINLQIIEINEGFGKDILEPLEFDEAWANKSEKAIVLILNDFVDAAEKTKQQIENNILAVATKAESLKLQYDLQSELNYKLILGDRIYTDGLADLQETLEAFAEDQKEKEVEAAERAEEDERRKAEKERQKLIDEQNEKERKEELQKQKELQEALEKGKQEEREKIEKENQEETERKRQIEENDRKLKEQEEAKKAEEDDRNSKIDIAERGEVAISEQKKMVLEKLSCKDYTMFFPQLTKEKAVKMKQFFTENNIKFEVM